MKIIKDKSARQQDNNKKNIFFANFSLITSVVAVVIAIVSLVYSNNNAKADRRLDTYVEVVESLDSLSFRENCSENGYDEIINNEINDNWMKEQLLDAVRIKAKLDILDEEKAKSYWSIISQIFSPEHNFDSAEYKKLKDAIKKEI